MPTSALFFVDHALSARLEATEAAQLAAVVGAVASRLPQTRAVALSIAGGCAAFVAPHFSLSRAVGLGMRGPVEASDIEALEELYRSRGTEARLLVSPFAHPSLFEQLGERGFQLTGLDTVLVRRLHPGESFPVPTGDVMVRAAAAEDAAAWVRASLEGFSGSAASIPPGRAEIFEAAFHVPSVVYFFASQGGTVAGTGAVELNGKTAYLFAASTLAAHRGRGVQSALIDARLALARERGCDLAFTATEAGSGSQRNFERHGFRPAYSQARLTKRFA